MKLKYFKCFLFMLVITFIFPISVFANEKIKLTTDKEFLEIGEEVTVTAKVDSNEKLYALTATLNFDNKVFSAIDEANFIMPDDTVDITYNPKNHKFGIINKTGEISGELFKVRLKVRKNANVGDANITLTNISSSDGDDSLKYDKANAKVVVTRDATEGEMIPNNKAKVYNDTKEDNIKSFSTKPIIIILFNAIVIIIAYLIYTHINDSYKKKKFIISAGIIVLLLIALTCVIIFNQKREDVNSDGQKDYDDAKEIIKYLIDIQGTDDDYQEDLIEGNIESRNNSYTYRYKNRNKYNTNNDFTVNVEDVAHSVQDINYKVELSLKDNEEYYVKKGEITLNFNAIVSPNEKISKVEIDGKYYYAINNVSYYSVNLNTPSSPGVHEFKITRVILSNGREIKVKLSIEKEILKELPYVDMFNIDDENDKFNFILEDKDNAFISGTVIIVDNEGNEILKEKVEKENHFNHKFKEDVTYTISVIATYDLDSNLDNEKNYYENEEIYNHKFTVDSDYNFEISNVSITDAIEKGEKPTITFDSTNSKEYSVEYIVIDGVQYNVTNKDGNHYEILLDKLDTSKFGKFTINIDDIVMNNLKQFVRGKDFDVNPLTYNVLKKLPTVENINAIDNNKDKTISVTYNLNDIDNTLQKLNIILTDSSDNIIEKVENITPNNSVVLSYAKSNDGRYKVKFLADCDLGTDRTKYKDKNIGEAEVLTQKDIYIKAVKFTSKYPIKNQKKYQITYEVEVGDSIKEYSQEKYNRVYNTVAVITVNGLNYVASKVSDFNSKITFTVPSESGVVDLVATRVQLQYEDYNVNIHDYYSIEPYTTQIDVLKDKPEIKNIEILKEDYQNGSTTFRFDVFDDDGGFLGGTIELNGESKPIKIGTNEVTFDNIVKNEIFDLKFFGDYDLDTNTLKDDDKELNRYTNQPLYSVSYGLFDENYYDNIELKDVTIKSSNNNEFFEKNEDIRLNFNVVGLNPDLKTDIDKIIIKGEEYPVEKIENGYTVLIKGYNSAGVKDIKIDEIILRNGRKVVLKESVDLTIEVLKDAITMKDFTYKVNDNDITMNFTIKDIDSSVNNKENDIRIKIYDEDNNELYNLPYNDTVKFDKKENIVRYYIKVYATYDRDITKSNNKNNYTDVSILDDVISLDKNYIELKDIVDVNLYTEVDGRIVILDEVDVNELKKNKDQYFVEVIMKNLPTIRANIKEVIDSEGRLILVLDYEYAKDDSKQTKDLRIDFGSIKNGKAKNEFHPETFETFVNKIINNPEGEYTLTNDLDAKGYTTSEDSPIINKTFEGILNGNGYTIKNLDKALFSEITGTVKNLNLENIVIKSNKYQGVLANTANKATIKNVLINQMEKTNSPADSGALIGNVSNNSTIDHCRVKNLTLSVAYNTQRNGGLVGTLNNSKISNSYVIGNISGNWNFIGALVGNAINSEITNSYTKGSVGGNISCGFVCSTNASNLTIKNSVSLATGGSNKFGHYKKVENSYYLDPSNTDSNDPEGLTKITQESVTQKLFKDTKFDEEIWNLKNISYDNTPKFTNEDIGKYDNEEGYDENNAILYKNLELLMPFYEKSKIIKTATNIPKDSPLYTEEIMHIVPLDSKGNIVTYLTSDDKAKIKKLKIVFKNKTKLEYDIKYDKTYDMVASYRISDLKIDYTFNHYVINSNSQIVNNLTNYLSSLTYEENLDPLSDVADSRIYKEYYYDVTKADLKEFVLKYLSSGNYTNTTNNDAINDHIEAEVKKDKKIEKVLYAYNYFKRFYSVDIDGMMLNDFILFNFQGFDSNLTPQNIADIFLSDGANLQLNATSDTYNRMFKKYTNIENVTGLLEYMVLEFSNKTPSQWYKEQFKGYLVELPVDGRTDIMYTLWDHVNSRDKNTNVAWYNYALPIITLPKNAAYIISSPCQFIIGAQRTYIENPDDPTQQATLQHRIETYATRMKEYYKTASLLITDAKYFNNIHTVQIDKRFAYDENGVLTSQQPYSTQEPFHKNFNEVIGQWAYADGNAATANGAYIIWRAEGVMDGNLDPNVGNVQEYTYHTWSHETAHNIDARLFLKDNGRRFDAGGEDYADSNLMQSFGAGDIVMNLSVPFAKNSEIGSNLTPERINDSNKIHDYYNKLFQTLYIMDYVEGEAFLKLTPEEQSKVAVQVSYPNTGSYPEDDKLNYLRYNSTKYSILDKSSYETMALKDIEDLYDNHLVIYPNRQWDQYNQNHYGGENIYKARWYQPHNDYGRPDSYSIKWFAYEMMGYAGYDNGYIEYNSNINYEQKYLYKDNNPENFQPTEQNPNNGLVIANYKTDLMALKKITNQNSYKDYKMMRFNETKANLEKVNNLVNINEMFNDFYNALKQDATLGNTNKAVGKSQVKVNSADVRKKYFYILKNGTDDFRGNVYNETKTQDVKPFTVPTE